MHLVELSGAFVLPCASDFIQVISLNMAKGHTASFRRESYCLSSSWTSDLNHTRESIYLVRISVAYIILLSLPTLEEEVEGLLPASLQQRHYWSSRFFLSLHPLWRLSWALNKAPRSLPRWITSQGNILCAVCHSLPNLLQLKLKLIHKPIPNPHTNACLSLYQRIQP